MSSPVLFSTALSRAISRRISSAPVGLLTQLLSVGEVFDKREDEVVSSADVVGLGHHVIEAPSVRLGSGARCSACGRVSAARARRVMSLSRVSWWSSLGWWCAATSKAGSRRVLPVEAFKLQHEAAVGSLLSVSGSVGSWTKCGKGPSLGRRCHG